jgi:hypothetical protein
MIDIALFHIRTVGADSCLYSLPRQVKTLDVYYDSRRWSYNLRELYT